MNPQNQLLCMLYTFSQCHYLYRPPIDCYDLVVDINDIEKEIVKSAKDLFEEKNLFGEWNVTSFISFF